MDRQHHTSFAERLMARIAELEGLFNAHLHIDRVETFDATVALLEDAGQGDVSAIGLAQKHALIPMIHASDCYDPDLLEARVEASLMKMAALGTTRAHSVVDVTPDRVGLTALERLLRIARRLAPGMEFQSGAYTPLGFRDDEPERWALIEAAAERADFIGGLPERDDTVDYPDHIGFDASCRRVIGLAHRLGKAVHLHVDQKNIATEAQAERVAEIVREEGFLPQRKAPFVWLIHVISPSGYEEARFQSLARDLAELRIGVICCPLAALSMRQVRGVTAPTHNSIARVLDLLAAGVQVRLGSDNVCDITSPAGTLDLMEEVIALAHAERFYDVDVLAHLATGQPLPPALVARVKAHLEENKAALEAALIRSQQG